MQHIGHVTLFVILIFINGCADKDAETTQTLNHAQEEGDVNLHPKLRELATLPIGIKVVHSPNPIYARKGGRSGYQFTWTYKTSIVANDETVAIEEFGSFAWNDGKWVFSNYTGKPFTPQDFAEWYSCPNAILLSGQSYSDPTNWTGKDALHTGKMKWYFIGRTEDGQRVKGEAVAETLAELQP